MILSEYIHNLISQAVLELYSIDSVDFVVEHPENLEFGDYATNVSLILSKVRKQAPLAIAKELRYKIEELTKSNVDISTSSIFESINEIAPGFINFKLSANWLQTLPDTILDKNKLYGVEGVGAGKRVALEHSNVNPNKAAHVGHLRNACIGQFIERVYEKLGFDVNVQFYANNIGVQVATSAMGLEKITEVSPSSYKKFDHYAWDVYSKMESKIQASEELKTERLDVLKKLENTQSPEFKKQSELANKILFEQLKTFQQLGFDYDVIIYESDIISKDLWAIAFEKLKANPNVYFAAEGNSKGCWLVKLGDKGAEDTSNDKVSDIETDKIIVRSNGVPTYTGKDIAYHMWKFGLLGVDFDYKKWDTHTQEKVLWTTSSNPQSEGQGISFSNSDYVFDVVGVEQTYAMDVVKRSLDFLGYSNQSNNMKHINYGFVYLSRNTAESLGIDVSDNRKFYAMSGRKGWGIKIDDLIDMIDARLIHDYGDFEYKAAVRNAAIKFQMLKLNTFQDLIFDLDEALDLKGYSGPYIQYACVRANSILKKAEGISLSEKISTSVELDPKEIALLRLIYRYSEIVKKSSETFSPNMMCEFLYELAKKFNSFYNDVSILNAPDKDSKLFRLKLCASVKEVLTNGLWLLGIDAPEKM